MDGYHLTREELKELPNPEEAVRRRGAEWTFNPVGLKRDLRAIKRFNDRGIFDDVLVPSFDHGVGDPVPRDISINGTAGIIIVEGNYLLYRGTPAWAKVCDCFDVKLYLSCDRDVCIKRLARRHMKAWNIPLEKAMERAQGSDTVNGDLCDTTQSNADLVLHSIEVPQSKL
jgi:pantothenate kinase